MAIAGANGEVVQLEPHPVPGPAYTQLLFPAHYEEGATQTPAVHVEPPQAMLVQLLYFNFCNSSISSCDNIFFIKDISGNLTFVILSL